MGMNEIAAGVFLGNILAASVILTIVKKWNAPDSEWSYWSYAAVLLPIAFFLMVLATAEGPPPFLGALASQ